MSTQTEAALGSTPFATGWSVRGLGWLRTIGLYLVSISVAFGLSAALVQLTGNSASSAFTARPRA